jgi:hypothetical protein
MNRASPAGPHLSNERRARADRRHRVWWSVWYGSFNPRRRSPARRQGDSRFHSLDWHSSHLLAVAISILLLSVADAFMTLLLLQAGAAEVNPIMAALIYRSVAMFTAMKMGMTGVGVLRDVVAQACLRAADLVILPDGVTFHIVSPSAKLASSPPARFHSHHVDVHEVFAVQAL